MLSGARRPRTFTLISLVGAIFISSYANSKTQRPSSRKIDHTLQLVADWQLGHLIRSPALQSEQETGWVQATFYLGLASLASTSKNPKYLRVIRQFGHRNHWRLGPRLYHADDQLIGQVYAAAFDHYRDPHMIKPMMEQFDQVLVNAPATELTFDETGRCQQRWCWCDALFMAPATWMAISRITGKRRYRDFANSEFLATKEFLLDQYECLFYRDSRFFDQRGSDGEKVFWSRGNGWVFAGLINILRELPHNYPSRNRYESLFIEMADKLLTLQRPDGFW